MGIYGKNERIENLKLWILQNKDKIKTVALPILVIAAVLFFWFSGKNEDVNMTKNEVAAGEVQMQEEGNGQESTQNPVRAAGGKIFVDIGGEVVSPGVYEVSEGTRLFEVINRAGGLTEEADIDVINRAEAVYDGQKILIASYEETKHAKTTSGIGNGQPAESSAGEGTGGNSDADREKVNINTADSAMLQSIPGIGPSKADRIIEYRSTQGRFNSIEDIKNISGIGNKTFENIKKYLTV